MAFSDTEANAVRYMPPDYDVVLLIDRSDSIGPALSIVKGLAKMTVAFLPVGSKVGVVSFNSSATVGFPLTTIAGNGTRAAANSAIDGITEHWDTSIGAGLQAALDEMNTNGDPDHVHLVILVSDGDDSSPQALDPLPDLVRAHLPVDTVGFPAQGVEIYGPQRRSPNDYYLTPEDLMREIARQTGGTFRFSPSLAALSGTYASGVFTFDGSGGLTLNGSGAAVRAPARRSPASTGPSDVPVTVDSTVTQAHFTVTWSDPSAAFDFSLVDPVGSTITSTTTGPDIAYSSGSVFASYQITNPVAGNWTMSVDPVPPDSSEPYSVRADAIAGLDMSYGTNEGKIVSRVQPIEMWATVADSAPILGATVNAAVTLPDGTVTSLQLFDDGQHSDGAAGDGTYANALVDTTQFGVYTITFSATGTSSGGDPFARMGQSSVVVDENTTPLCDLYATMTGQTEVKAGEPATYSITFGNHGPDACGNFLVGDVFAPGTEYVDDSRGGGSDLYGVGRTWPIGSLAAGSEDNFTITVAVPPTMTLGTRLTNQISVYVDTSVEGVPLLDLDFGNNASTVTTQVSSFSFLPFIKKN
ncbi:MAG: VWA domain-containing protein [Chloroflexi bacterium]|nr:VWA domain-containing protein [Chloroflexota bacterium]